VCIVYPHIAGLEFVESYPTRLTWGEKQRWWMKDQRVRRSEKDAVFEISILRQRPEMEPRDKRQLQRSYIA